ncbi:chaperonin 10-like protein [Leucosporidium creatinivorum]|uniref:Chaperonin 10-like protein n=1 Tax=Leucosporidium creatinivorum TaxID=106004 RepID=A0A1Y2CUH4_9BASI|nr:chaperonin 10-like protein [Leucosporidium creatinivorum]
MPSFPATYKAAQIQAAGETFKIVDVDWKDPQPGQIVVKVLASGVCHSDSIVQGGHMGVTFPRTPGHEIIGKVVAVGEGEKTWKVGQRVGSGWHGGHCFNCKQCRKGDFVTCSNENINGIITDGGHAEYATLRSEAVLSIPDDISSADAAPLLCAGVTVFNSLRHMDIHAGDVVAVQGVGGLGHLAIQYSRAMGYRTIALSRGDSKKALAMELGAHDYLDSEAVDVVAELQKLGGAKVAVAVAPSGKAISSLLPALAVEGQLLVLAVAEDLVLPIAPMIMKRLSVRAWPSGTAADSADAVAFAQTSGVKCYVEKYSLDQINEAYDAMMNGKARFRAVLTFDE